MELKSSGKEQQFENGAMRDTADNKPIMSLLSPYLWQSLGLEGETIQAFLLSRNESHLVALMQKLLEEPDGYDRLCRWLKLGAARYSAFNWTKGMPLSRCVDSLGRHLLAMQQGKADEDHKAAFMCNLMFIIHYHKEIAAGRLDRKWYDLWDYQTKDIGVFP